MRSRFPIRLLFKKVLLHNPGLGVRLSSSFYHKYIRADRDYRRADGVSSKPPAMISLRITNACNHRCDVCGQYGTNGYMKSEQSSRLMKTLPVETYKKLIDEVAFCKPILYITGGEPFLYPGLFELIRHAKSRGLIVALVTNGVTLKRDAEKLVKNKVDMILVSFDGPEEIHDKCRNVKGAFQAAYEGLLELQRAKKRHRSIMPYVLPSTTLSRKNANQLDETFNVAKELNADLMIVYLSWFTNTEIGKAQEKLLDKELGVKAYTWKSYCTKFSEKDAKTFSQALTSIKTKKWPFDYFIIPDVGNKNYAEYYLHPERLFGYAKCVAPFIMVDVMPNGDVTTCRDFIDVVVGNIMEDPLLKIWNNQKFVQFRKLLIKNKGTLPQCSRCCGLMGF